MTIQQAIEILKPEAHTVESLKKAYRAAAKLYHPDINPNGLELMKLVNAAMDLLTSGFDSWSMDSNEPGEETPLTEALQAIFDRIKHCIGIKAEICGTWLWVTGNTRPYKELFKEIGLKWSAPKCSWYWHEPGYRKHSRRTFDLESIRTMWGSRDLETEPLSSLA